MAMVKCKHCGKSVSDKDKLCEYCGEQIERNFKCPDCGSENIALSEVGEDPNKEKKAKLASSGRYGGLFGRLLTIFIAQKKYPDIKDSQIEFICNDCGNKFRRY